MACDGLGDIITDSLFPTEDSALLHSNPITFEVIEQTKEPCRMENVESNTYAGPLEGCFDFSINSFSPEIKDLQIHNDSGMLLADYLTADIPEHNVKKEKDLGKPICRIKVHNIKKFICNICGKSFIQMPHWKKHVYTHRVTNSFCHKLFRLQLKSHYNARHTPLVNPKIFRCNVCNSLFSCIEDLHKDQKRHEFTWLFKCSKCSRRHRHFSNAADHRRMSCTSRASFLAPKLFNKSENRGISHILAKPDADIEYSHNSDLVYKKQKCFKQSHVLKFDACGHKCLTKSSLDKHCLVHMDAQKQYQCMTCKKQCKDASSLKNHLALHADQSSTHQCLLCRKSFTCKRKLKMHTAHVHPATTHPCSQCDMTFKQSHDLKRHERRIHQNLNKGKPKVMCTSCPRGFSSAYNLKRHFKQCHKGEQEWEQLEFALETTFCKKQVDMMQSSRTIYTCTVCGRMFNRRFNWMRHESKKHNTNV